MNPRRAHLRSSFGFHLGVRAHSPRSFISAHDLPACILNAAGLNACLAIRLGTCRGLPPAPNKEAEEDLDGEPMLDDDEDVDGEPMPDEDSENEQEVAAPLPAASEPSRREALAASIAAKLSKAKNLNPPPEEKERSPGSSGLVRKRQRPKAEDMFADSEGE